MFQNSRSSGRSRGCARFELNTGGVYPVQRTVGDKNVKRDVRLIKVEEFWEPDHFTGFGGQRTLRLARVTVDVSGVRATLPGRPYQMPVVVESYFRSEELIVRTENGHEAQGLCRYACTTKSAGGT